MGGRLQQAEPQSCLQIGAVVLTYDFGRVLQLFKLTVVD